MPTIRNPRRGTLQFWPRKRAARIYSRIRNSIIPQDKKVSGFAGYKVGMTHVMVTDNRKNSVTKGMEISFPVTIVECPPLKLASVRAYKKSDEGLKLAKEVLLKTDKELSRKLKTPKKEGNLADIEKNIDSYSQIRINVYTQPKLTGIGKKKPEFFELKVGGKSAKDQLDYAKELIGKEISVKDVFQEGQQLDVFAITKGKGFQGPVKRHGVQLRSHKSEKVIRGPGNLGAWTGNRSWTVAHAGQTGFHQRMEKNKWILRIGEKTEDVIPKGGFKNYGLVKSNYLILKGSIQGPAKRLVRFEAAQRPNGVVPNQAATIEKIIK